MDCYQSLLTINNNIHCPRCLSNLAPKELICHNCKEHNFAFDRIISAYSYTFPLNKVLHQLKYHAKIEYSTALSQLFWLGICGQITALPEIIIPVPLHPRKHTDRGFNQVQELLREFSIIYPEIPQLQVYRHRDTMPQASLSRSKRIMNLRNAFKIPHNLNNKHVAIIDDVVTTGSTVNELAHNCKKLGAKKIDVWCLMRAQY